MEKKTVLENLDLVLLVMDETVDGGYVGLTRIHSPKCVCWRVPSWKPADDGLCALCYDCKHSQHMSMVGSYSAHWTHPHTLHLDRRSKDGNSATDITVLLMQSDPGDGCLHNSRQSGHAGTR